MAYLKNQGICNALTAVYHDVQNNREDPLNKLCNYLESADIDGLPHTGGSRRLLDYNRTDILKELLESYFEQSSVRNEEVREILQFVMQEENKRGYKACIRIASYLESGDPSYITAGARNTISGYSRYDLIKQLLREYLQLL